MIYNLSSDDTRITQEIDAKVGKRYGFFASLFSGGSGSQRLLVVHCSEPIQELFDLDRYPNHCNIELRPKGIIIHFRSRLDMFAWVIEASSLKITLKKSNWEVKDDDNLMELHGANNKSLNPHFFERMEELSH